jgi:hypothetical protein
MGIPKFPKLRLLQLWGPITLSEDLRLKWSLNQSCNRVESFPTACCMPLTHKEIGAIPDFYIPSFGHNLCLSYPNGSCEPISYIYVPISFQCYKELFNSMSFDPWNCLLKIQESIGTGSSLFCTFRSMKCDSQAQSWPAPL